MAHDAHQLIIVLSGAVLVENNSGTWPVPAGCAAWIPARTRHALAPTPTAQVRTLYIYPPSRLRRLGGLCVVATNPLLRAIVDHVHRQGADTHLAAVVTDQVAAAPELPLFLPTLSSPIARRIAEMWSSDPAGTPRIRELAAALRVSDRTLERAFVAETAMTLGEWRLRARIARAIALLAGGMEVKDVALEVGYESPSAFVVAFKKYVGITPGKV